MTAIQVVALYGALHMVLSITIMMYVGARRAKTKVSVGDGGDETLIKAMRCQANYVESAPIALIGLVLLGLLNASVFLLHILGAAFFIGRLSHFLGMGPGVIPSGRMIGAILSLLSMIATALALFYSIFF